MTFTTAPLASPKPVGAKATKHSLGRLWQVPLFLVGLTALVAVAMNRHCEGDCDQRALERELVAARHLLNKPDGNLETVVAMIQKVLDQGDKIPRKIGEAHFLLGSTELRLADRSPPAAAHALYRGAREHLEDAEREHVGPKDEGLLRYRLAKAAFHTGDDPARVVERLEASKDQADELEKAEAYNLLTQAYLNLPQPNYMLALAANDKLRRDILPLPPAMLSPAQLLGGTLLLKLNRPEEARKVLERIGVGSPADKTILAQSRLLRAQSFQDEQRWSDAATLWQSALTDLPEGTPQRTLVLFSLGCCYRRMDKKTDAKQAWEHCCGTGSGEAVAAAALSLAEMYLQEEQHEQCMRKLAQAVRNTNKPEDWKTALFPLTRLRELFEAASRGYRKAAQFDLASQLLAQYEHVAVPGRTTALKAETSADQGRALRAHASTIGDPEARGKEEEIARAKLCEAGQAYVKTAAAVGTSVEQQAHLLWLAIACFREAPDNAQVLATIDPFLQVNQNEERKGEALYLKGETFRLDKNLEEANKAYFQCIQIPTTPFAFRARYQQALLLLEKGNLDKAAELLEQNLKMLNTTAVADGDTEAMEKSLVALGGLRFKQRNYRAAHRPLAEVLVRFPTNPEAIRARYQVAESFRQLAIQANQEAMNNRFQGKETHDHYLKEYKGWLGEAAREYYELAHILEKSPALNSLTEEEKIQVPFLAAECRFNLGRYEEALKLYDYLATHYDKRTEGLNALGGAVRCLAAMKDAEQLKMRLNDIERALERIDGPQRKEWQEWLEIARRPTGKP